MENHSCDCCVSEPGSRNMPVLGCWSQSGHLWDASSNWGGSGTPWGWSLCREPGGNLPGFMKSQSHVTCPVSKKPLVTEGAAGAKGTLRKVSELGIGAAGRGTGKQKSPKWEWGT